MERVKKLRTLRQTKQGAAIVHTFVIAEVEEGVDE
jgi:hypothetical protein